MNCVFYADCWPHICIRIGVQLTNRQRMINCLFYESDNLASLQLFIGRHAFHCEILWCIGSCMYLYVTICVWFCFKSKCLMKYFLHIIQTSLVFRFDLFKNSISRCLLLITVKMYFGHMTFLFL